LPCVVIFKCSTLDAENPIANGTLGISTLSAQKCLTTLQPD